LRPPHRGPEREVKAKVKKEVKAKVKKQIESLFLFLSTST